MFEVRKYDFVCGMSISQWRNQLVGGNKQRNQQTGFIFDFQRTVVIKIDNL